MNLFPITLIALILGISLAEDLRRKKIPNIVTFPGMIIGISYHVFLNSFNGLLFGIAGGALGISFFLIPYLSGGMGAGDVKLMGALGAILGPKCICFAAVAVYTAGGICGLFVLILHPKYALSSFKRLWLTIKTFLCTAQFILIPPDKNEKGPVLLFAIPITLGILYFLFMTKTGYELIPKSIGNQLNILIK